MDAKEDKAAKLTNKVVGDLKPPPRRQIIWDTQLKGFGVRVEPSGHKTFVVRYRPGGGGRNAVMRQMVVGRVGLGTVEEARKEAAKVLTEVAAGADPAAGRHAKRNELTVAQLCDLYMKEGTAHKKRSTLAVDIGRIERHIKPLLGRKQLSEVQQADIRRAIRDVAEGKTAVDIKTKKRGRAVVTGGTGAANRVLGLMGGIFTFAVNDKLMKANPCRGVKRYREKAKETFLALTELSKLGDAIKAIEERVIQHGQKEIKTNPAAIAIIRLLLLTGARKSEISQLRWSEIDFERSYLRLDDSKTGQKFIALGAPALEILTAQTPRLGSEHVFPADVADKSYDGVSKVWRQVRQAAGMPALRIHDLRHSFASVGLAAGDSLTLIGKLLGHADNKTTQRYAHLSDDPLRKAANRISEQVSAALNRKPSAKIVSLREVKT